MKIDRLGIIAGNGNYPILLGKNAIESGVKFIVTSAFKEETSEKMEKLSNIISWFRVGQLSKMISFFKKHGISQVIMAGQITPNRLFSLRPDFRTLKLLARTKKKNAESLFSAIGDELKKDGIDLLLATNFMEKYIPSQGLVIGKEFSESFQGNVKWGFDIIKKISGMDIGQSIVIRDGTVLAVEGFDGTNETIKRGGKLGKGKATLIKVSKKNQDLRFDVPVIGLETVRTCYESGIKNIIIEAGKTIILDMEDVLEYCKSKKITIYAWEKDS